MIFSKSCLGQIPTVPNNIPPGLLTWKAVCAAVEIRCLYVCSIDPCVSSDDDGPQTRPSLNDFLTFTTFCH